MANVKDLLVNGSARVIGTIYGNATSANKVNHSLTFGSKSFNGSSAQTITLADLGGKPTQSAVSSPSASGTEISFIDTISQNANGVITATKKTVRDASASQSGVVSTGTQSFAGVKTFNNTLNFTSVNNVAFNFRPNLADYYTTVSYQTNGNEALVFATKQSVTSFMFVNGEDSVTNHSSDRWRALTPTLQMKNKSVYINSLIDHNVIPSYNLYVNGTSYFSDNISIKAGKEIKTAGTQATSSMIRFLDNTSDAYGNGISIGGGGVAILGAGESASSLSVAAGTETLYLLSDGEINIEANGDTIANRIGFRVNTAGHLIPVKAESGTDNTQNIGASGNRWANIYATTFHGALDGNASSATKANYLTLYESRGVTTNLNKTANYVAAGAMFHLVASSSTTTGKCPTDANILQMNWDNSGGYDAQIGVSTATPARMYFRSRASEAGAWQEVAHAPVGSSVGSTTTPVYMNAEGIIKPATGTLTNNISGNASSATKLQTARTIWGQSFNGTANISGDISNAGNIKANANSTRNIGESTVNFNNIYTRALAIRHIDAGTDTINSDHQLYIGYGSITHTNMTRFYYSSSTSSRTEYLQINSNGAYALTRFGVNGQNTSYNLYVNGTTRFNNTLYFFNSVGDTALSIESRRSKNSSNANIETNTGLVTKNKSFIEIRGFAPPTMVRTTGDRPAPYGLGFSNGNESAGIMPIGEGDKLQELMFYGANSGPTLFTWKYQTWESTTYDSDNSNGYSAAMMSLNSKTGDLYVKNTIGINGQNTGYNLYVNGSSNITGNLKLDGSITNLAVNGGIYWNPYVESASDASDAASITVVKSGVAGGTELRISQANDSNDIVNISVPTNDAARINNNIILNAANYTNYTVTKTGSGASGTWGINITGNANNSTSTSWLNQNTSLVYGTANRMQYYNTSTSTTSGASTAQVNPYSDWFHHIRMNHNNSNGYYVDLAFCFHSNNNYIRRVVNGSDTGWARLWTEGNSVTGAVWNDYAEYREADTIQGGHCVREIGDDTLALTTKRLMRGCSITSDTWGFAQGETDKAKTPIAVAGRVLAYPLEDRELFREYIGYSVCSGPNGTVSLMTEEEELKYPWAIIGTVSAVPDYEEWGGGEMADRPSVKVDGRIWIKVK